MTHSDYSNGNTKIILSSLEDRKAFDIKVYDFPGSFAEKVIVCTAFNSRHISAILESLKSYDVPVVRRKEISTWMCLSSGDVLIHIVTQDVRDYYQLDEMYH